jgi:proliferating cell nuclear antigen
MYILELKTVQSSAIRVLVEALKEILTDVNILFDETGMKIMEMDSSHTVLVYLKLDKDKFEYYNCTTPRTVGISMINFFKLIKTMTNNDTLTLYIDDIDEDKLGIKIENGDKNSITTYKLNLMDLNDDQFEIPSTTFNFVITMPSIDFQKICRDMNSLATVIDIQSVGQQLRFSCKGDFAEQETIIGEATNGMVFVKQNENVEDEIVQGLFMLKNLVMFTKCTNLSNTVDIYLKNNYPLVICYNVGSLGILKLCLAPKIIEE